MNTTTERKNKVMITKAVLSAEIKINKKPINNVKIIMNCKYFFSLEMKRDKAISNGNNLLK